MPVTVAERFGGRGAVHPRRLPPAPPAALLVALASLLALPGCRTGTNYPDPLPGIRPPPAPAARGEPPAADDSLRVVTFNVRYGEEVEGAVDVLAAGPPGGALDLVLLQEMDEAGTRAIADALGMGYVYYPAVHHRRTGRDFGNAVLTPWPVLEHERIVLPHVSLFTRTQRTATAATVRVEGRRVRVYSTHLGMALEVGDRFREDQLETILDDARNHPLAVVGGDMNSGRVGRSAARAGFRWPTEDGPRTATFGRLDHVFLKGFGPPGVVRSGTGSGDGDVSDHRPVWVVVPMPARREGEGGRPGEGRSPSW